MVSTRPLFLLLSPNRKLFLSSTHHSQKATIPTADKSAAMFDCVPKDEIAAFAVAIAGPDDAAPAAPVPVAPAPEKPVAPATPPVTEAVMEPPPLGEPAVPLVNG